MCTRCGREHKNPLGKFYKINASEAYRSNSGFTTICIGCVNELYSFYKKSYGEKTACVIVCALIDLPFHAVLYDKYIELTPDSEPFPFGKYIGELNKPKYLTDTFKDTLANDELFRTKADVTNERMKRWSNEDLKNAAFVVETLGYDPFENYPEADRLFLFKDLVGYLSSEDEISDDKYKASQYVQIVINNFQISKINTTIFTLDTKIDASQIKDLNVLKKDLISMNDKIAKENEISVKNRSNKEAGKSTFTYLQRKLREMDFDDAEANYYSQLVSPASRWAIDMSNQSILEHCMFDENDKREVLNEQRLLIQKLQEENDTLQEKNRLLLIKNAELNEKFGELPNE